MALKHLEHDGDEDYLDSSFPNRQKEQTLRIAREKAKPTKEERLAAAQKDYMSLSNPLLWDGEI